MILWLHVITSVKTENYQVLRSYRPNSVFLNVRKISERVLCGLFNVKFILVLGTVKLI